MQKNHSAVYPVQSYFVADAQGYIRSINHPGVQSINGDVYHMQAEEQHIGEALLSAGEQLVNLHKRFKYPTTDQIFNNSKTVKIFKYSVRKQQPHSKFNTISSGDDDYYDETDQNKKY